MIRPVDRDEFQAARSYHWGAVQRDIIEFVESDWSFCEVDVTKYRSANNARNTYSAAVKNLRVGVQVIMRGNRVFMAKGEPK